MSRLEPIKSEGHSVGGLGLSVAGLLPPYRHHLPRPAGEPSMSPRVSQIGSAYVDYTLGRCEESRGPWFTESFNRLVSDEEWRLMHRG